MSEKRWYTLPDGRQVYRRPYIAQTAQSDFPCPRIHSDKIDPCRAMDGKITDSLSHLRSTYKASGNPHGTEYIEIGNEEIKHTPEVESREDIRNDIKQAIAEFSN